MEVEIVTETVPVTIKWGKKRIPVEIDYSESPMVFKAQLMTLTNVPIERQKVIFKGKILDDDEWAGFLVTKNTVMTMVGTDAEILMGNSESNVAEEPTPEQIQEIETIDRKEVPLGFTNLGNTCYMNAAFQLLKCITPIKTLILKKDIESMNVNSPKVALFLRRLKDVYHCAEPGDEHHRLQIGVNMLVSATEDLMPEFATRDKNGARVQQDANEFILKVFSVLRENFNTDSEGSDVSHLFSSNYHNVIDTHLRIELDQVTSSQDIPSYEPTKTSVPETILSVHIDSDVRDLMRGLQKRMNDTIEMYHEDSQKDALFQRQSTFARLPAFLCIHFGRFFYKSKQNVCAKVLREVKLPFELDLFTMCSDELQKTLIPMRTRIHSAHHDDSNNEVDMTVEDDDIIDETPKNVAQHSTPYSIPEQNLDVGSNGSGMYNLKAIITHKGRYSNSGHYVTWVKITDKVWAKLDDSQVSIVSDESIKKLYGGGEWHSAYVVLYESATIPSKH